MERADERGGPELSPDLVRAVARIDLGPGSCLKDDAVSEVWSLEPRGGDGELALLKRARSGGWLFGLPPRLATAHEVAVLRTLEGLTGVPRVLARIDGRTFVREFVGGCSLDEVDAVSDEYFPLLLRLLGEIHDRGVACVDLSKRENLLVDEDGRPALMDFQAAFSLRPGGVGRALLGPILRLLQRGDVYHVYKHHRRRFPGAAIPEPPASFDRKPLPVRIHGVVLRRPYRAIRRLLSGSKKEGGGS